MVKNLAKISLKTLQEGMPKIGDKVTVYTQREGTPPLKHIGNLLSFGTLVLPIPKEVRLREASVTTEREYVVIKREVNKGNKTTLVKTAIPIENVVDIKRY